MKLNIAWLAVLCFALAPIPVWADYDNGPINGTTDAWAINYGYIVSDTYVSDGADFSNFSIGVWEFPGDRLSSLQWSVTSAENGGTVYGSGTAYNLQAPCARCRFGTLTDHFISTNQFGYDIDLITVKTGMNVPQQGGATYWLNLQNAAVPSGNPVFWDENSGKGCFGRGCPSKASESAVGTIASEAFTINSCAASVSADSTPEPSSILLFGSGILALVGVLHRRLNL